MAAAAHGSSGLFSISVEGEGGGGGTDIYIYIFNTPSISDFGIFPVPANLANVMAFEE